MSEMGSTNSQTHISFKKAGKWDGLLVALPMVHVRQVEGVKNSFRANKKIDQNKWEDLQQFEIFPDQFCEPDEKF